MLLQADLRAGYRIVNSGNNSDRYFELQLGAAKIGAVLTLIS